MKIQITLVVLFLSFSLLQAQEDKLLIAHDTAKNVTATYQETIQFYENLAEQSELVSLKTYGKTDSGFPLHVAILSKDKDFSPASIRAKNKRIVFVNNAIHAGESCGVEATMQLFRDLAKDKKMQNYLENVVLVAIPFYNIGGGLNRGAYSRANQNGAKEHGFRGNAKNLDLNRDFIKADSKNAQTFNQIFTEWQPDIFVDTHTSNGADYQYVITLIATQKDKLESNLAAYMEKEMLPDLYKEMGKTEYPMIPYVNVSTTPDEGIYGFLDLPRYASGYATLHNAISFITETHMFKPYQDRVSSTYFFLQSILKQTNKDYKKIKEARDKAIKNTLTKKQFAIAWDYDMEQKDSLLFKGYEAKYKASEISGLKRLYYDRNAPYEKYVPYLNSFKTSLNIQKPVAYLIPQAYGELVQRLKWNGVEVSRLTKDVELNLEMYRIEDYKTSKSAYEGHYNHSKVEVRTQNQTWKYYKGDYVIFTNQKINRYIIETLEPQAPDSFFNWNFFDGILGQKEYFSSYIFEETALELLKENPKLKAALEAKKQEDEKFAQSARMQLDFVYKNSVYYEPTHNLYPVGRMIKSVDLPLEKVD
jgi:hypothetical protein